MKISLKTFSCRNSVGNALKPLYQISGARFSFTKNARYSPDTTSYFNNIYILYIFKYVIMGLIIDFEF